MTTEKALEIQRAATQAAIDVVKAQVAAGKPNKGINKARHGAIVADVASEMIDSFAEMTGDSVPDAKSVREVLRAAFTSSILNASQLRQELEKAGVLVKETALNTEYGVES